MSKLFNKALTRLIIIRLVGGEDFGVDMSLIKADASRYTKIDMADRSLPIRVTRAMQGHLDTLKDAAFGSGTSVQPIPISGANPAVRYTGANSNRPFFANSTN